MSREGNRASIAAKRIRPERDHRPERREREGRRRGRRAEIGHVELRPVAVDRLADAVEDREPRVDPEPPRDAAWRLRRRRGGSAGLQRQARADEHEHGEKDRGHERQAPPRAEPVEDRDEHRGEHRAEAEQGVEHEDGAVGGVRVEIRGQRVQRGDREAEACAEGRGGEEQQRVRARVARDDGAREEQDHRDQAGAEAGQVDPLRSEPLAEARAEQRRGDRRDDLRQEERPVLARRQVVLGRVGEDRARRRERDERDALHDAGGVDDPRLG